jgi:hypothetical protein
MSAVRNTGAGERRRQQHLHVVGRHPHGSFDNMCTAFRIDQRPVPAGYRFAEREFGRPKQIARLARCSMPLKVRTRCAYDHPARGDPACYQRRVLQSPDPDSDVDARIEQIDITISKHDLDIDLQMVFDLARNDLSEMHRTERNRRCDPQHAPGRAV